MEQKESSITTSDDIDNGWIDLGSDDNETDLLVPTSPIPNAMRDIKSSRPPSPVQKHAIDATSPIRPIIIPSNVSTPLSSPKSPRSPLLTLAPDPQQTPTLTIVMTPSASTPPQNPIHQQSPEPVAPPIQQEQPQSTFIRSGADSQACVPTQAAALENSPNMPIVIYQRSSTGATGAIGAIKIHTHAASRAPLLPHHVATQIILPLKPSSPLLLSQHMLPTTTSSLIVQSLFSMCLERRTHVVKSHKIME